MINRTNVTVLAVFTLVCFFTAGLIQNDHEGVVQAIGDVAWFGFLLGFLLLVVVGVSRLVRWLGTRGSSAR